jgi:hypothetical protein
VGTAPVNLSPGAVSSTSGSLAGLSASGPVSQVIAYAVYYGGLVPGDPAAGTFTGAIPAGAPTQSTSAVAALIATVFPPADVAQALKVAGCESGMRPNAVNHNAGPPPTNDEGVFQLNTGGTLQGLLSRMGYPSTDVSQGYNASTNIAAAYQLYKERGWEPWYSSQSCWAPGTPSLAG